MLYKLFSESHVPGIQKLTNESIRFKWYIVGNAAWPRVHANASTILTESTSRSKYKMSVHEESSIKLMKNAYSSQF